MISHLYVFFPFPWEERVITCFTCYIVGLQGMAVESQRGFEGMSSIDLRWIFQSVAAVVFFFFLIKKLFFLFLLFGHTVQ